MTKSANDECRRIVIRHSTFGASSLSARTSCPKSGGLRRTTRNVCRRWSARPGFRPSWPSCLVGRGIDCPQAARDFLDAKLSGLRDPELLPGAVEAAEILHQAIAAKKRIIVYGDYDADGMTATAILLGCLKLLGANADYYVPNRIDEGLRPESRGDAGACARRGAGRRHGRLRHRERRRSGDGGRVWPHADHHRSSSAGRAAAARGGDRASGLAGRRRIRLPVCAARRSR